MSYDVNKTKIGWAIEKYGSISKAIDEAEKMAVQIFKEEDEDEPSNWADTFFPSVRNDIHRGDCNEARSWLTGPITCHACVYDEYMSKAWERLNGMDISE
jgi:hypothetical protein